MDPDRIRTIKEWESHPPRTYRDLQVFLGFCNFYRRFIRQYSAIAQPLTSLLKGSKNGRKSGDFSKAWGSLQQQAFLDLLGTFQTAPLLQHYDPELPIRLETDASDVALGGVLSQLQTNTQKWHPIAFFSKQFKGAEVHYATPDKELMAIVECFKHWRHYLEGTSHTIEVWSDHMNLQSFMRQPRINGRQARWLIYLTPYDFIIRHRPGLQNPADGPSRRPDYLAQKGPNPVQDNLLASRLVSSYSDLQNAAGTELPLCRVAKCQLCEVAEMAVQLPLYTSVKCQDKAIQSRPEGTEARLDNSYTQLCDTARPAPSEVGSRPALSTTIAGFKLLRADGTDDEAGHLIDVVRLQVVTRVQAKAAAQNEDPLSIETAPRSSLLDLIFKHQGTDPLCIQLKKELRQQPDSGREYSR